MFLHHSDFNLRQSHILQHCCCCCNRENSLQQMHYFLYLLKIQNNTLFIHIHFNKDTTTFLNYDLFTADFTAMYLMLELLLVEVLRHNSSHKLM